MSGSATLTIVRSRMTMTWAIASTVSTSQGFLRTMIAPQNRSSTEWFWQRSAIRDIVQLMNDSPTESAVGTAHAGGPVEDRFCTVPMAAAERLGFLLAAVGGGIDELAQGPLAELGLDHHDYTVLAI